MTVRANTIARSILHSVRPAWLAPLILLIFYGLALNSADQKSPTFDEQAYIVRGLGYLRGQNQHMRVGHPLGLNALNAAFLVGDEQVQLPTDDPSWQEPSFHRPAELFLWEIGNDVTHIMFLARLPTIWLGMLLAAVTGCWAFQMTGNRWAGLLALSLISLEPNILAHTRLATTDLGVATGAAVAAFTLWRALKRPSWTRIIIAGAGFGLLQNTKSSAIIFIPFFALVIFFADYRHRRVEGFARVSGLLSSMPLRFLVAYPLVAFIVLWASYGFQMGTISGDLTTSPWLSSVVLPLPNHLEQLIHVVARMQRETPAFLAGQYSESGWWYYHPIVFLVKTPLPFLVLLAWALLTSVWRWRDKGTRRKSDQHHLNNLALLIPGIGFFATSLASEVSLGIRHILPVLPFFSVFIANSIFNGRSVQRPSRAAIGSILLLMAWMALTTIRIHPHYLAYFNELAGGADGGWRVLVDSNLDWGQDLGALKQWMDENGVDHVWLSYFGEARPEYYGIDYTGLDSYPPRLMNPEARPFYPHDPAPGFYAISATNLQGALFTDHRQFAWFREREPLAKIGYSIFIYQVPARGTPAELLLSGLQLDQLEPDDFARLGTNQVTPHWFDPGQSQLLVPGNQVWWALSQDQGSEATTSVSMSSSYELISETEAYRLLRRRHGIEVESLIPWDQEAYIPLNNGTGSIAFMGVLSMTETAGPTGAIEIITAWEQQAAPQPVKIFVHAIGSDGQIATQWDGLGAAWEGWRQGDVLIQVHQLPLGDHVQNGLYQIWTGLYHPDTGQRWQTDPGDRIALGQVSVNGSE